MIFWSLLNKLYINLIQKSSNIRRRSQRPHPSYALRSLVRPVYARAMVSVRPHRPYASLPDPSHPKRSSRGLGHGWRTSTRCVRAYAPRIEAVQPSINRNARVPEKSPHFSHFSHDLASFSVPVQTRSPGHFAQVPKVDFTPEIPENPEENPFPEAKLYPVFHLAISKTFKWVSYPLNQPFKYSKCFYMLSKGGNTS